MGNARRTAPHAYHVGGHAAERRGVQGRRERLSQLLTLGSDFFTSCLIVVSVLNSRGSPARGGIATNRTWENWAMRPWWLIVLVLPLGGSFAHQQQQLASCKIDAMRLYPNPSPFPFTSYPIEEYVTTCM